MGIRLSHLGALNKIPIVRGFEVCHMNAIAAGHTPPTDRVYARMNRFYRDLQSAGILGDIQSGVVVGGKLDLLYNFTHDGSVGYGYQNWAKPVSNVITVGAAGLVHTANDGLKGNGSGYLILNYSASSGFVNFGVGGFSLMSIVKESTTQPGMLIGRTDAGSTNHVWLRPRGASGADLIEARIAQNTNFLNASSVTDGSGWIYADKESSTVSIYRNNVLMGQRSDVDLAARPAGSIVAFARSAGTGATIDSFTTATQRMLGLGAKLSSVQRAYFLEAWNLYYSSL